MQKMEKTVSSEKAALTLLLLESISAGRYRIIKEHWTKRWSKDSQEHISKQITAIRDELYETLTGKEFIETIPMIEEIAALDESRFRKSIMILMISGFNFAVIADILCVNTTFIKVTSKSLITEYPEIFK